MGAAFDDPLIQAIASIVSTEGRAFNNAGRAGLDYWTPNINRECYSSTGKPKLANLAPQHSRILDGVAGKRLRERTRYISNNTSTTSSSVFKAVWIPSRISR